MSSKTLYCCESILVKNDEGDALGWDLVCDKDIVQPSYDINLADQVLDFLRTDVSDDVIDFLRTDVSGYLPAVPIPFGVGGDGGYQFGGP